MTEANKSEIIEVSGKTLQDAVQLAAQQLGVSEQDVEYEVVEEGTQGFLGLGQSPTLVRAHVREGIQPAPVQEIEAVEEQTQLVENEIAGSPSDETQLFVDSLTKIVGEVVKAMGVDAAPVVRLAGEDEVEMDLVGDDVGILVGKHGQTLDALQYLMGICAGKTTNVKRRVILDAEGYRQRHKETLEGKAREYANYVKEEGKEAVLEPQSPRDRRIVHMALADNPDVYTYSEGEGENRHVVISPKK